MSPMFPSAIQTFLIKPILFARLIGLVLNCLSNSSWVISNSGIRLRLLKPCSPGWNKGSLVGWTWWFTGQTSWHMSHPNTQSPINPRSSFGMDPLDSIVRNEMHRLLSNTYGAIIACVGHSTMQIWQIPQFFFKGWSSDNSRSVIIWPKNTQEP